VALIRYLGVAGELGEGTTLGAHPAEGQVFGIRDGQSLFIGRGSASQIVIESNRVARAHVTLALMPGTGDRLVVTDLDSTNKTSIDGEVKTSGVLAPGQELVIAGLFRFRFEDGDAPGMDAPVPALGSGLRAVGVVLLVVGMLMAGVATFTRTWFVEADEKADIGLNSYRACREGNCTTFDLSSYSSGMSDEEADRSSVFSLLTTGLQLFVLLGAGAALWAGVQLARGRRATALWFMIGMVAMALVIGLIVVGMLPVRMEVHSRETYDSYGVVLARTDYGVAVQWLGFALAIASAVLLLRRPKGNEAAAAGVPGE
jgi:hypothetical protein